MISYPDFKSKEFLKTQIFNTLHFYYPRCVDLHRGGFFNGFRDDGSIPDENIKHLIGTTRFTFIFSIGTLLDGPDWCLKMVKHGIDFLQTYHYDAKNGGYHWELNGLDVVDSSKQVYGHAHVILASSMAFLVGVSTAKDIIESTFALLERYAWREEDGLYVDDFNADWSEISSYRGQNSNMHMCEAMIAAFEATGDQKYLNRAVKLANAVAVKLSSLANGLIWDNYNTDWTLDVNKDPKNIWRRYGFLTGHIAEWSKLIAILSRHHVEEWMLPKAEFLFRSAIEHGWDEENGGLQYSFDFDGKILDSKKNWWVISEAIGAAAILQQKTGNPYFSKWYQKLWEYAWIYLVDHQHGAWYSVLSKTNQRLSDLKSPFHKTDYHPIGAMFESIRSF